MLILKSAYEQKYSLQELACVIGDSLNALDPTIFYLFVQR